MTIRVVTDSTSDLPVEVIRLHNITVIPLMITVDGKELRDGVDISRGEFYAKLQDPGIAPQTAAPGHGVFRKAYERLASEGANQILSIHITQKLSSTIESARLAAADTKAAEVIAFDSRQVSLGTGFAVLAAAKAAEQGRSLPEILDLLDGQIRRTRVCAAPDTLEFMYRGGHMNGAVAAVGNLLHLRPILKMYEGETRAERARTRGGALKRMRTLVAQNIPYERVAILHAGADARAREFLQGIADLLPAGEIWVEEINPATGAQIGPGAVGFAGISKKEGEVDSALD